eukprot:1192520-Prorocentrum_minimum.AAC.5
MVNIFRVASEGTYQLSSACCVNVNNVEFSAAGLKERSSLRSAAILHHLQGQKSGPARSMMLEAVKPLRKNVRPSCRNTKQAWIFVSGKRNKDVQSGTKCNQRNAIEG